MSHAKELVKLVHASGLTYDEIAVGIGRTRQCVSNIRNGADLSASTLAALEELVAERYPIKPVVYVIEFEYDERHLFKLGSSKDWPKRMTHVCREYSKNGAEIAACSVFACESLAAARSAEQSAIVILEPRRVYDLPKAFAKREVFDGFTAFDHAGLRELVASVEVMK